MGSYKNASFVKIWRLYLAFFGNPSQRYPQGWIFNCYLRAGKPRVRVRVGGERRAWRVARHVPIRNPPRGASENEKETQYPLRDIVKAVAADAFRLFEVLPGPGLTNLKVFFSSILWTFPVQKMLAGPWPQDSKGFLQFYFMRISFFASKNW